ncbi:MAG: LytR C-terminal domain-containing protein [Rhodoglobus sp.]|nr:LytR C-terminal domain-containing protein [Rhodoglobus sp.]
MAKNPKDRFDQVPHDFARIGAHRGPKRKGRGWIGLAWSLLAIAVLVFGGLFTVGKVLGIDLGIPIFAPAPTPTPTPTPIKTASPVLDPTTIDQVAREIKIDVLNGSPSVGLEDTVGAQLAALGWRMGTFAAASQRDVEDTFVYYSDPANEDVARGLVLAIGAGEIRFVPVETFPGATVTIVLGADFPVPTPAP